MGVKWSWEGIKVATVTEDQERLGGKVRLASVVKRRVVEIKML